MTKPIISETTYIQSLIDAREQESLAPYRDFMVEEHIRNLTREIESFKKSQASDPITEQLYQAIMNNGTLSYAAYGELIGVSEATIKRRLAN